MEPFSALAVATSVVQFVDFGAKLISRSVAISHSDDGLASDHVDVKGLSDKLRSVSEELESSLKATPHRALEPHETDLLEICKQCQQISAQLSSALSKIQQQGKTKTWGSLAPAFQSILGQRKIQGLQARLDGYRQQLVVNILISLRHRLIENPSEAKVRDPKTNEFVSLGTAFLRHIDESHRWQTDLISAIDRTYSQNSQSARIVEAHEKFQPEIFADQILSRLCFSSIEDREHRIPEPFQRTYDWIYKHGGIGPKHWSSFPEWLEEGVGMYWITGKPGAGKSTLMKFICRDRRTMDHLKVWSSGSQLMCGSFFSWNSGAAIQMSQEGLLRSLLYDALQNCRDLVPKLFPSKWESFSLFQRSVEDRWTWAELHKALEQLVKTGGSRKIKFCFFVDGLDEFDGSHVELIGLFKRLIGSSNHVKMCVSSRPWSMFEDAFKNCPSLALQDLTEQDIIHFISSKLQENDGYCEMEARDPSLTSRLVTDIAGKASGVFLWVDLVVRSLLEGLTNGDRMSDLQKRVNELPAGLENLFRNILERVRREDQSYFVSASRLFQLIRATLRPPTLISLYFADEGPEFVDDVEVGPLNNQQRWSCAATMKRRLNSSTKGLLEIDRFSNEKCHSQHLADLHVQYLHRTVRDYFAKEEVWEWIAGVTGTSFIPNLVLCKSFIALLKVSDPLDVDLPGFLGLISACFKYATLTEKDFNKLDVHLLEQIDSIAHQVTSNPANQGTFVQRMAMSNYHWSSALSGGRTNSTFLSFAVRFRLDSYVDWKIKHEKLSCFELSALLHTAVIDFDNLPNFGCYRLEAQGSQNMELIRSLVKLGANPYEEFHGLSAYGAVLDDIHNQDCQREEILRLFKRYGRKLPKSTGKDKNILGQTLEEVHTNWSFKDQLAPTLRRSASNTSIYRSTLIDENPSRRQSGVLDKKRRRWPWS